MKMLKELLLKNRSFRSFNEDRRVTNEELLDILDTVRKCPSARNLQPLKYKICTEKEACDKILSLTGFAGALRPLVLPPKGHAPTAYIVICSDNSLSPDGTNPFLGVDVGIAAEAIMLMLTEKGLGGCMLGAFSPVKVSEALGLDAKYIPKLILAIGEPDERIELEDCKDEKISYYRTEDGVHRVPKRKLEDIIL